MRKRSYYVIITCIPHDICVLCGTLLAEVPETLKTNKKIRHSEVSLEGRISRLAEQQRWLYALIALQQHLPIPRRFFIHLKTGWAQEAWLLCS